LSFAFLIFEANCFFLGVIFLATCCTTCSTLATDGPTSAASSDNLLEITDYESNGHHIFTALKIKTKAELVYILVIGPVGVTGSGSSI
jgi:hypothetical protein